MTADISLRKNFALTAAGNLVYGVAQWAMLVMIAKLGTPEMLGRFALAMAITAPVILFANLNLRSVLATDAGGKYKFGEYLALRLVMLACALIFIFILAEISGYDRELTLLIVLIGLAKGFESVSDIFFGLMQHHERMARISISLAVKGGLSLALFTLGLYLTRSLLWGSVCLLAAWALSLFICDLWNARRTFAPGVPRPSFLPLWSGPRLKTLLYMAIPLGIAALLDSLLVNIPRYFVGGILGERGLGFFAAMAYVPIVGARVVNALGTSAVARLARYYQRGETSHYRSLLLRIIGVGFAIGAGGLIIALVGGKEILTLLYRPEYAEKLAAFVWIMIGAGIGYIALFMTYGLMAARQFRVQPFISALACAVIAIACLILIPSYGITGAAMAVTAGAVTQAAGNGCVIWRVLKRMKPAQGIPN